MKIHAMTKVEYQEHMEQLTIRVEHALVGANVDDAVGVCAGICGRALGLLPAASREQMVRKITNFIRDVANDVATEPVTH